MELFKSLIRLSVEQREAVGFKRNLHHLSVTYYCSEESIWTPEILGLIRKHSRENAVLLFFLQHNASYSMWRIWAVKIQNIWGRGIKKEESFPNWSWSIGKF